MQQRCCAGLLLLLAVQPALPAVLLPCDVSQTTVTTVAGGGTSFLGATALTSTLNSPSGLSASPAGVLYVADTGNNVIRALNLTSGTWVAGVWNVPTAQAAGYAEGAVAAGTALFKGPLDVAYSPCTGQVYVADAGNFAVRVLTPSAANVSSALVAGNPSAQGELDGTGTSANFNGPLGLALAPGCARLYVSSVGSNMIKVIALATRTVTTLAGSSAGGSANGIGTAAQFYHVQKLALDATGTLLRFGNRVRFVPPLALHLFSLS
jgi:DNA-binding beta-propeller fold protein YncE